MLLEFIMIHGQQSYRIGKKVKKRWGPRTPERYMHHWGASQGRVR